MNFIIIITFVGKQVITPQLHIHYTIWLLKKPLIVTDAD